MKFNNFNYLSKQDKSNLKPKNNPKDIGKLVLNSGVYQIPQLNKEKEFHSLSDYSKEFQYLSEEFKPQTDEDINKLEAINRLKIYANYDQSTKSIPANRRPLSKEYQAWRQLVKDNIAPSDAINYYLANLALINMGKKAKKIFQIDPKLKTSIDDKKITIKPKDSKKLNDSNVAKHINIDKKDSPLDINHFFELNREQFLKEWRKSRSSKNEKVIVIPPNKN